MRIRSIKPEFWSSEDIAALPWDCRLLFIGLWSYVDDSGVGRDNEKLIVADLFPLEDDTRDALATVSRGLDALTAAGLVNRYTVDGRRFLHITTWRSHQKIDRPANPRYPSPTCENAEIRDALATPSRHPIEGSSPGTGEQGNRGTGEQGNDDSLRSSSPSAAKRGTRLPSDWQPSNELVDQMRRECPAVDLRSEHRVFADHWASQPGQKGVKTDWAATWRNWMRRANPPNSVRAGPGRRSTTDDRVAAVQALKDTPTRLEIA